MSYVSEMRSNLSLLRRSNNVRSVDIDVFRSEFASYLARRVLIYPPALLQLGLRPDMSYQDRKSALGLRGGCFEMSPDEVAFRDFLETSSRKARRAAWIWRIGTECEDMRDRGWFPFFVTLTVDPKRVPDAEGMWREGREFRRYIRRLARVSAAACGAPDAIKKGASCSDFVRHVGVIEHGASNQHHHMHLLVWMRGIPDAWKVCPNRGIVDPRSRTITHCRQMGTYWPHSLPGIGRAMFFRHEGDVWSALGFATPVDRKTRRPIKFLPARAAGMYVSKYMEKGDKAWLHRVKASRDLGKARLRSLLHRMAVRSVEALTWRPRKYATSVLLQTIHSVPSVLLRSMAKQVLFCKTWVSSPDVPTDWTHASCGVYPAMVKSVRDGMRPHRMSLREFYDWVTERLPVPNGYCEKRLQRAHMRLHFEFAPDNFRRVEHLGAV